MGNGFVWGEASAFCHKGGDLGRFIHLTVDAQCDLEIRGGSAEEVRSGG